MPPMFASSSAAIVRTASRLAAARRAASRPSSNDRFGPDLAGDHGPVARGADRGQEDEVAALGEGLVQADRIGRRRHPASRSQSTAMYMKRFM